MKKRDKLLISVDRLFLALDVLDFLAYGTDSRALSREKVLHVLQNGLHIDGRVIATVWARRASPVKGFWAGASALVRVNARLLSDIELDVAPLLCSTLLGEPQAFDRLFRAIACGEITEESFAD